MESYAPLFVNVSNPRSGRGGGGGGGASSMQWSTDLIGYDALGSYGSPSYYVQKMFSLNHGDDLLATTVDNVPTRERVQAPNRRGGGGTPRTNQVATVFIDATRDSKTKTIYVKVVNSAGQAQDVHVEIAARPASSRTAKPLS